MKLGPVDHVWFWTSDMDASIRFYVEVLGLPLVQRFGNEWAELAAGPIRIGLHGTAEPGRAPHTGTVVFRVDDLEVAKAGLEAAGVSFDAHLGEVAGVGRYASFSDPDGNSLQLFEYSAETMRVAAPRSRNGTS